MSRLDEIRYELTKPVQSQFIKNDCEFLLAEIDRLRDALQRVKTNADSWHGPEGLRTGHARALAVIADWCAAALAGEDKP